MDTRQCNHECADKLSCEHECCRPASSTQPSRLKRGIDEANVGGFGRAPDPKRLATQNPPSRTLERSEQVFGQQQDLPTPGLHQTPIQPDVRQELTEKEIAGLDEKLDEALPVILSVMGSRLNLEDDDEKLWSIPFAAAMVHVEDGLAHRGQNVNLSHLLRVMEKVKVSDYNLLPRAARLQALKEQAAALETERFRQYRHPTEKSRGKMAAPPSGTDLNDAKYKALIQGLRVVFTARGKINAIQVVIRDIANAKYDDEEQELRRQRIRCIMAVIPNADLIKALCECGKLDPRHAFRNRLKSDIEKILANPLWVQGIDDFSKSNPNFFESNIVEAGKETFELGAHDSPKEVHCLACIVAGQAAPDAPLQCSLVSEDLGDACIQCKLYGDGSCRFLCEECSKKLQDDPDCFADLDDNCTSCVYRQIEDIGPFETSAPMDEDLEPTPIQSSQFDDIRLPNHSHLLWDNDGLVRPTTGIPWSEQVSIAQDFLTANEIHQNVYVSFLYNTTNDLFGLAAPLIWKYQRATDGADKVKIVSKMKCLYDTFASMYFQTKRSNMRNAAALLNAAAQEAGVESLGALELATARDSLVGDMAASDGFHLGRASTPRSSTGGSPSPQSPSLGQVLSETGDKARSRQRKHWRASLEQFRQSENEDNMAAIMVWLIQVFWEKTCEENADQSRMLQRSHVTPTLSFKRSGHLLGSLRAMNLVDFSHIAFMPIGNGQFDADAAWYGESGLYNCIVSGVEKVLDGVILVSGMRCPDFLGGDGLTNIAMLETTLRILQEMSWPVQDKDSLMALYLPEKFQLKSEHPGENSGWFQTMGSFSELLEQLPTPTAGTWRIVVAFRTTNHYLAVSIEPDLKSAPGSRMGTISLWNSWLPDLQVSDEGEYIGPDGCRKHVQSATWRVPKLLAQVYNHHPKLSWNQDGWKVVDDVNWTVQDDAYNCGPICAEACKDLLTRRDHAPRAVKENVGAVFRRRREEHMVSLYNALDPAFFPENVPEAPVLGCKPTDNRQVLGINSSLGVAKNKPVTGSTTAATTESLSEAEMERRQLGNAEYAHGRKDEDADVMDLNELLEGDGDDSVEEDVMDTAE